MRFKWIIFTISILLFITIAFIKLSEYNEALAAQDTQTKIESLLQDEFSERGNADFIIQFKEQADLSAAYSMDWEARGEYVYNTLRQTADHSQSEAKRLLKAAGLNYQPFINGNELYVWAGNSTHALQLANLPEVSLIRATRHYYIDPYTVDPVSSGITWAGDLLSRNLLSTVGTTTQATTDWGITDTKANQFWTTFGMQGDGILVANIDTGVQWNHPALDQAYKCFSNPSNPACWRDPANICGGSPCDNNGHGTHTMGTMIADDDPSLTYIAGMAPNAKWIACKGCESKSCSESSLNACADWILAPGGNPANRPQVVNNSWGGDSGVSWFQGKVQAWVAAGIFPAFSAGNTGPGCNTLGSPGDYQASFASASHTITRAISDFSSKGPSTFGHDPYTKPNISAPGSNICSSLPGNSWGCGSGTSMASPHSAGAVALLWSCNPALIGQVDSTFQILQNNADSPQTGTCGAPPDGQGNYTYGYGYLDVLNAGYATCTFFGTIDGYVYNQLHHPLLGVKISATPVVQGIQIQVYTDQSGHYSMRVPIGTYNMTATRPFYQSQTVYGVQVTKDQVTHQDFSMLELAHWTQALPIIRK